jgi:hypothetical protein
VAERIRILFLAANPIDGASQPLRLDEEIREIQSRIRAADFRESFEVCSRWAVRPGDLLQAFNEVRPQIVHFSGHGSEAAELVLEDNDGNPKPVSDGALIQLFRTVKGGIRLVVLNACHSVSQAEAISKEIECTIGMSDAIDDQAAVVFASQFYGALAFGQSVGMAYQQGKTALMLEGILEEKTPVLLARPGVDALAVSFVVRRLANPILPPIALEILQAAVTGNAPVNYVRYDGGIAIMAGDRTFDCAFNLERAARLAHGITLLVQEDWLKQTSQDQYHVTHAGYEAARRLLPLVEPEFVRVKEAMPELIAEMKKDLETEEGRFVREFFVMSKSHVLGGLGVLPHSSWQ